MQAVSLCLLHLQLSFEEEAMSDLMWRTDSRKEAFSCRIFSVNEVERTAHDGRHGTFVEIESPDWIVAIPWLRREDGVPCFVMEEQYRHGSDSVTREFPAGLVEKGEEAIAAAERELMEETGIRGEFIELGRVCPNSAFMSNHQSFFLVRSLEKVSGQSLDENEEIVVIEVPVEDVIRDMGRGLYDNGIMMMALGFFLRYSEEHPELMLRKPI